MTSPPRCADAEHACCDCALCRKAEEDNVRLRSEAEAPFRSLRFTLFGFSMVSSGLGTLISIPQLIGALRGAGNLAPSEVYENIAINVGAFAIFAFLFRNDWIAREKQMARLQREERLGALKLVLANGKVGSERGLNVRARNAASYEMRKDAVRALLWRDVGASHCIPGH